MCDREAAIIPGFCSFALLMLGGFLFVFEYNRETPMPELQRQLDDLHAGNETLCLLQEDVRHQHQCRVEGPADFGRGQELLCFCKAQILAQDGRDTMEAKVVLGPTSDLKQNASEWCKRELMHDWPNVILLEHVGKKHWSCNIIVDDDAEPCHSGEAEKTARQRQSRHWRCFNDIMYNTRRHHKCVMTLTPNVESPCVRLGDGRLLLGQKSALLGQLDEHHGSFHDSRQQTLMVTSLLILAGLIAAFIAFCWCLLVWRNERQKGPDTKARKVTSSASRTAPVRMGRSSSMRGGEIECRQRPNTNDSERDSFLVGEEDYRRSSRGRSQMKT